LGHPTGQFPILQQLQKQTGAAAGDLLLGLGMVEMVRRWVEQAGLGILHPVGTVVGGGEFSGGGGIPRRQGQVG
jgi:hypothetical protein